MIGANINIDLNAVIQNNYSTITGYYQVEESVRNEMFKKSPELYTSGKLDAILQTSLKTQEKVVEKEKKFDENYDGSKKQQALDKYKDALKIVEGILQKRDKVQGDSQEKYQSISERLTQAVSTNWSQTYENNLLNVFTNIGDALIDIEVKFSSGQISESVALDEVAKLRTTLTTMTIDSPKIKPTYVKLYNLIDVYSGIFAQADKKSQKGSEKLYVEPKFSRNSMNCLRQSNEELRTLVSHLHVLGDKKHKHNAKAELDAQLLYEKMQDTQKMVDSPVIDEEDLVSSVDSFYDIAQEIDFEMTDTRSQSNQLSNDMDKIQTEMQKVSQSYIENTAKITYEESYKRVNADRFQMDQINALCAKGLPPKVAEKFWLYLYEKYLHEANNSYNLESFSKVQMDMRLRTELEANQAELSKGVTKDKELEIQPPSKDVDEDRDGDAFN